MVQVRDGEERTERWGVGEVRHDGRPVAPRAQTGEQLARASHWAAGRDDRRHLRIGQAVGERVALVAHAQTLQQRGEYDVLRELRVGVGGLGRLGTQLGHCRQHVKVSHGRHRPGQFPENRGDR